MPFRCRLLDAEGTELGPFEHPWRRGGIEPTGACTPNGLQEEAEMAWLHGLEGLRDTLRDSDRRIRRHLLQYLDRKRSLGIFPKPVLESRAIGRGALRRRVLLARGRRLFMRGCCPRGRGLVLASG
jgi:hypothetical protein